MTAAFPHLETNNQNVGGSDSISPPGGANRPGKYTAAFSDEGAGSGDSPDAAGSAFEFSGASAESVEYILCPGDALELTSRASPELVAFVRCSSDVLELLGDAISPGCSRITVINPSAASNAATLTEASRRLLLE